MSVELPICSLFIITFLLILLKAQKNLKLQRDKIFGTIIMSAVFNVATSLIFTLCLNNLGTYNKIFVEIVSRLYLFSFILLANCSLFYILIDFIPEKLRSILLRISYILMSAELIAICLLPLTYSKESIHGMFTGSYASILTMIAAFKNVLATIVISIVLIVRHRKRSAITVLIWMISWIAAFVAKCIYNPVDFLSIVCALGMLTMYVMLELPETNIDKLFGCFNSYAFSIYLNDMKRFNRKFSLLEISLYDKSIFDEKSFHPINTPKRLISWIRKNAKVMVFKNMDYSLYIVSKNPEELVSLYKKFYKFISVYHISNRISFAMFKDSSSFNSNSELQRMIAYAKNVNKTHDDKLVIFDSSYHKGYLEEQVMIEEIKSALINDRILIFLQPIYCVGSGKYETAEVLARLLDRTGNIISPGKFISVAESNGLIMEVGERVLRKTCELLANNRNRLTSIKYLEVNLAIDQCERIELADKVATLINNYNIDPSMISFEITETGSVKTRNILLENMNRLIELGTSFSLDDFGKGESNLDYLIDMPVSYLKLDLGLTKAYWTNEKAKHTIINVINLAHNVGCKVVAEGIEDKKEYDEFIKLGVDNIQGYYISKPIPEADYLEFVKLHNN